MRYNLNCRPKFKILVAVIRTRDVHQEKNGGFFWGGGFAFVLQGGHNHKDSGLLGSQILVMYQRCFYMEGWGMQNLTVFLTFLTTA